MTRITPPAFVVEMPPILRLVLGSSGLLILACLLQLVIFALGGSAVGWRA